MEQEFTPSDKIRKCRKEEFFSEIHNSESGYIERFGEEIVTDKIEYYKPLYDTKLDGDNGQLKVDNEELKRHPVTPQGSPIPEFQHSFESTPDSDTTIVNDFNISLKFQDSEFISSFNNEKYEKKYGQYQLSQIELPRKIVVLGDAGIGKTSYVQRYISKKFESKYLWTVGVDFALKVVKWSDNVSIKLQLWDIAGQERFASMTRVYYKDAHACIVMFDLTHRQSFENALRWKRDLDDKCTLPDGSPIPCILLANKCDLEHREVNQSEIERFCSEQEFIGWTEVSVKDGLMVEESMKFLLDDMMTRYGGLEDSLEIYETDKDNQVFRLDNEKSKEVKSKKKCC